MQKQGRRWRQKGFTLIEGVITAVIMAILAAVAIPMYNSYVSSQRQSSVKSLANAAAVNANYFFRRGVTPDSTKIAARMLVPAPYGLSVNSGAGTIQLCDGSVSPAVCQTVPYK